MVRTLLRYWELFRRREFKLSKLLERGLILAIVGMGHAEVVDVEVVDPE